jgi:hypothetical protein
MKRHTFNTLSAIFGQNMFYLPQGGDGSCVCTSIPQDKLLEDLNVPEERFQLGIRSSESLEDDLNGRRMHVEAGMGTSQDIFPRFRQYLLHCDWKVCRSQDHFIDHFTGVIMNLTTICFQTIRSQRVWELGTSVVFLVHLCVGSMEGGLRWKNRRNFSGTGMAPGRCLQLLWDAAANAFVVFSQFAATYLPQHSWWWS